LPGEKLMSIRKKIMVLLGLALLALVTVGGIGLWQLHGAQERFQFVEDNIFPSIKLLQAAERNASDLRIMTHKHLIDIDPEQKAEDEKLIREKYDAFQEKIAQYEKGMVLDEKNRSLLEADRAIMAEYWAANQAFLEKSRAGEVVGAAINLERGTVNLAAKKLRQQLQDHIEYNYALGSEQGQKNLAAYNRAKWLEILFSLAAVVGVAMGGFLLGRTITESLAGIQRTLEQVKSSKDFTLRASTRHQDEVGKTASAFNGLLNELQQSLSGIAGMSRQVSGASAQMYETAQQISRAAQEQSEASATVAATVEQMTVSINHVGERASEAQALSQSSSQQAAAGSRTIGQTIEDIRHISAAVMQAGEAIRGLDEQSARIINVVQVIREVADQTNLLALNAAIEAARAGESGRGFAVVADEVRKLAERTASSTHEISASLDAVRESSMQAVAQMKTAETLVEGGVARADEADQAMRLIGASAADTSAMVGEITMTIREQGVASNTIATQVERIAQMTEESSAAAAQTAGTVEDMKRLAEQQTEILSQYKI
jgi:methyl-accepting chemotaxis protein